MKEGLKDHVLNGISAKVVLVFAILLIPMYGLLLLSVQSYMDSLENQAVVATEAILELNINNLNAEMERIDRFFYVLQEQNTDYQRLCDWQESSRDYLSLYAVNSDLLNQGISYQYAESIFLYAEKPDTMLMVYSDFPVKDKAALGYLITQVIGIVLIPFTNILGGTQSAWIIVAAVFGVVGAVCLTICFRATKERYSNNSQGVEEQEEEKTTVMEALKILVRNKYWWMMMLSQTALSGIYTFIYGALAFYCMFVLGNDNLTALVATVGLIPSIIGFVLSPILIRKFGMRKTGMIAATAGIIGTIIRIFAPANMLVFIVGNCLVTFATAPIVAVLPAMVINCAEWNDYKFGVKLAGMTNSVSSFGGKIGAGFAGALLGWVLAWGKFDGTAAVQPDSAITSIYALNIWIPGILLAIILICYACYGLEKKYPEIVKANAKRRAKSE